MSACGHRHPSARRGSGRCVSGPARLRSGPTPRDTPHGYPQHRDHRARRPWQDHAGRRAAEAVRRIPRQPGDGRARARFQRPRARARHHHPRQGDLGRVAGPPHQHRRHARATPTSAARSSASSAWWTACCCWSTPPRGRCRRPSSCTAKALRLGLRPIVVLNKVDKPDAEPDRALNEVFDLFVTLDANADAARLPGALRLGPRRLGGRRARRAAQGPRRRSTGMILDHVPAPAPARAGRRALLDAGDDAGRRPVPRPAADRPDRERHGPDRPDRQGARPRRPARSSASASRKILAFRGLVRTPIESAEAGDIVSLAGMAKATVADTIADFAVGAALPAQPIDPPTISRHLRHQRLAPRRPRRRQGAEPGHPRPADARGRDRTWRSGSATRRAARPSRSPAAASCRWAC